MDIDALYKNINKNQTLLYSHEQKIQLGHFLNGGEDNDGIIYDETGVDGLDESTEIVGTEERYSQRARSAASLYI